MRYNNYSVYKRERGNAGECEYRPVAFGEHKIDRPTVIVIGGLGTKNLKYAAGYAKIAESLMPSFLGDVDVLTLSYKELEEDEEALFYCAQDVALNLFDGLIKDDEGKRLGFDAASKNMRNITFFTHCYGDILASAVVDYLAIEMWHSGYSKDETESVLSQIFLMSYGINYQSSSCKKFSVFSPYDLIGINPTIVWQKFLQNIDYSQLSLSDRLCLGEVAKSNDKSAQKQMLENFYSERDRCFVVSEENLLSLATGKIHNNVYDDHSISEFQRDADWNANTNLTKTGDIVSRCMSAVLCHSVASSLLSKNSDFVVPVSMEKLKGVLCSITRPLNFDEKIICDFHANSKTLI